MSHIQCFPLSNKRIFVSEDKNSWKRMDFKSETEIPTGNLPGAFGCVRKNHIHEGVDIYCTEWEPVRFIRDGVIVAIDWFTGENVGSLWWNNTMAILVEDKEGCWNYGEVSVSPDFKVGQKVKSGEHFGFVVRVLKENKGRPMDMLHLERYIPGTKRWIDSWNLGMEKPNCLVDPTPELLKLL